MLRHIVSGLIILSIGGGGMIGLAKLRKPTENQEVKQQSPLVETARVESCSNGFHLSVDGEVIPYRRVTLSAEVAGRVIYKSENARAGGFVKKDEVLYRIDPRDYDLEIKRLQEAVTQAGVSIEEADIEDQNTKELIQLADRETKLLRAEVERLESLEKKNAASIAIRDEAIRREIQALNNLQKLKSQRSLIAQRRIRLTREKEQATTALMKAQLDRSRTEIVAPMDGVVMNDAVERDNFVQPGSILADIEDVSKVEVRFNLQMRQLRWLWANAVEFDSAEPSHRQANYRLPPTDIRVFFEVDGRRYYWIGTLSRFDGAGINPTTRTIPCVAVVHEPANARLAEEELEYSRDLPAPPTLLRGMFVTIEIPVSTEMKLVQLPATALRPGNQVWVVDDGKLAIRKIQVANAQKETIVIAADLSEVDSGDKVIVSPLPLVVNGMDIREEESVLTSAEESDKDAT